MKHVRHNVKKDIENWWSTDIIEMYSEGIRYHGYAIEDLLESISFVQMIWLMTRGELPSLAEAKLLNAVLLANLDYGPKSPSIAVSRIAISCGIGLNNAMASGINMLGDITGGSGEQTLELYELIAKRIEDGESISDTVSLAVDAFIQEGNKYIPGFDTKLNKKDSRVKRLLELIDDAVDNNIISGKYVVIGCELERELNSRKDKELSMNIDGVTAIIYGELGFAPPLVRGISCISRAVGILAHTWEQMRSGERNKGPVPHAYNWNYSGVAPRDLPS